MSEIMQYGGTRHGGIEVPGGRLSYEVIGGDKPNIPLIAIPGGPGYSRGDLITLRDEEITGERPLVLYDPLGSGKSDIPDDPSLWVRGRYVQELVALIDHVKFRDPLHAKKVHLLGHSFGATIIAEHLTQNNPDDIASATFVGPVLSNSRMVRDMAALFRDMDELFHDPLLPGLSTQELAVHYEETGDTENPRYKEIMDEFDRRHELGRDISEYPDEIQRGLEESSAGYGKQPGETVIGKSQANRSGNIRDLELVPLLSRIRIPVYIASGERDISRPDTVAEYAEAIPGSEFSVYPGAAHMVHLENPELFLPKLAQFLRKAEAVA